MITTSNIFICEQIPTNYDKTTAGYYYLVFDAMKWLSPLSQISLPWGGTGEFPFIRDW